MIQCKAPFDVPLRIRLRLCHVDLEAVIGMNEDPRFYKTLFSFILLSQKTLMLKIQVGLAIEARTIVRGYIVAMTPSVVCFHVEFIGH